MYGTQTTKSIRCFPVTFENDVKMYGTQTKEVNELDGYWFENDVKFIFVNNKNR